VKYKNIKVSEEVFTRLVKMKTKLHAKAFKASNVSVKITMSEVLDYLLKKEEVSHK